MLSFISDIYAEYLFLELYTLTNNVDFLEAVLHTQPRRRGHGGGCALYSYTSLK